MLPSPCLVFVENLLSDRLETLARILPMGTRLTFAMKAAYVEPVLEHIRNQGHGLEVMTVGEWQTALALGYRPKDLIVNGMGRSIDQLLAIASAGSFPVLGHGPELASWKQHHRALEAETPAFGLRLWVPELGARYQRFGIRIEDITQDSEALQGLAGVTIHGWDEDATSDQIVQRITTIVEHLFAHDLLQKGFTVDLGGGRRILQADMIPALHQLASHYPKVIWALQPGRAIVEQAGIGLGSILTIEADRITTDVSAAILPPLSSQDYRPRLINDPHPDDVLQVFSLSDCLLAFDQLTVSPLLGNPQQVRAGDRILIERAGAYTTTFGCASLGLSKPMVWWCPSGAARPIPLTRNDDGFWRIQ